MLPAMAAGAALHSEQGSLVRQERQQVHLSADGEVTVLKKEAAKEMIRLGAQRGKARTGLDYCFYNYTKGAADQSNCTDPASQQQIEEAEMCRVAAKLTDCEDESCFRGSDGGPDFFMVGPTQFDDFPLRCFKGEDGKWGFNPGGAMPTAAKGTPVCYETNYINGTAESSDCGKPGYAIVTVEDDCRTVAACLSDCVNENFRVLDAAEEELAPLGCHIAANGCAKFNTKITGTPTGPIVGIPLCRLAQD